MARPRDIVKWLTGFIGYANLPKPDLRQAANRLKTATNVWFGGAAGITRRLGMSLGLPVANPIGSVAVCPAQYGNATYSAVLAYAGVTPLYVSSPGTPSWAASWTYTAGYFSHAPTLNGKAHLMVTGPAYTPMIVDVSRAQMLMPSAPTAADTGSGTYAAVQRYYRVQWNSYSANQYDLRGPVGPALTFTPSGSGTGVVVTRPVGNPGYNYWLLWGSTDGRLYYLIARTAIATTTFTDSTVGASAGALADAYLALNNTTLTDNLMETPVRRVGMLAVSGAPTAADTGVGAYAATARYYRIRWVEQIAGVTRRLGEPSTSVSFTPSGAGTGVTVTRPSAPAAEWGVTHWRLEASTDNSTFYVLNTFVISSSSITDSTATTDYSSLDLSETLGDYTEPPNARTAVVDRDRVLFGGGWTSHFSRIWYTPVLGTSDVSDDERVPTANYFDIEATDGDEIRALVGPVFDSILVFKRRSIFRLTRTGLTTTPYQITKIADGLGCDGMDYVCVAPGPTYDEAVYFINTLGAWRYDAVGGSFTRLNDDLDAPWDTSTTVNGRVVYYPTRHAVLFGEYAYSLVTGGWSQQDWTHGLATKQVVARFLPEYYPTPILMMPSSGASSEGLYNCDYSATTDAGNVAYVAEVRTNRFSLTDTTTRWRPVRMRVWGSGGALTWSLYVNSDTSVYKTTDFTLGSTQDAVDLSEHLLSGPVEWLSISLKDRATASTWTLDAIEVTGIPQEPIP